MLVTLVKDPPKRGTHHLLSLGSRRKGTVSALWWQHVQLLQAPAIVTSQLWWKAPSNREPELTVLPSSCFDPDISSLEEKHLVRGEGVCAQTNYRLCGNVFPNSLPGGLEILLAIAVVWMLLLCGNFYLSLCVFSP